MIEKYNLVDSYQSYVMAQRDKRIKRAVVYHYEKIRELFGCSTTEFQEECFKHKINSINLQRKLSQLDGGTDYLAKTVNRITYMKIVYGFMKFMMRMVMEGYDVKLPAKLGIIGIRGRKVKPIVTETGEIRGVAPSWSKTKIQWTANAEALGMTLKEYIDKIPKSERKLIYCLNEHSDYIKYRIAWYKKKNIIFKNKILYGLTLNRANKRMVYKLAHKGKEFLILPEKV